MVQFGNPIHYGVIKRIETAVDSSVVLAEVETVSYMTTTHMISRFTYVAMYVCSSRDIIFVKDYGNFIFMNDTLKCKYTYICS